MKRKMKAVAALSLAAVMLLAGCGSSKGTQDGGSTAAADTVADTAEQQAGTETAASDSGEKIVIRVVGPMENENDTTNPVTKQTVRGYYVIKELYEAEHPNVELQLTGIPWDSWQAKLTTVAAANQVDVVVHGASIVDIVEDLTPYAEKDGDFLDGLLLKYSYRRADKSNYTKLVPTGIPITAAATSIMYDKKIFDDYGLDYPDETWTWEDVLDAAKKMTGTDPVTGEQTYGYYIDGASSDWVGRSMIGYYFSKDTKVIEYADKQMDTKVNYTSPEALKGFEFVNELAKTCPKGFLEGRGAENFGTENNNIAMWYSQNLVSNYQKTESLGLTDRYGYAYSPVLENGREGWANFTGDWNMAIAKNAQNKEACWEFIKWMATNQDIADWCWEGGKIPNNKEAIERLSAENIPFADVFFNTLAATPDNFTIFASEYDDAYLGSSNAFKANGLSAMFAGDLTPEEAAENIQAAYEEQAASYQ